MKNKFESPNKKQEGAPTMGGRGTYETGHEITEIQQIELDGSEVGRLVNIQTTNGDKYSIYFEDNGYLFSKENERGQVVEIVNEDGTPAQSVSVNHQLICRSILDGKIIKIGIIKEMNEI
jgi:hypothetical protein